MENLIPFLLIVLASFFQGSFGVGMKFMEPLKWESWWVVHVFIAMVLFPLSWTLIAVPESFKIIIEAFSSSNSEVLKSLGFAIFLVLHGELAEYFLEKVSHILDYH